MIDAILDEFKHLAAIPRPSGHEEAVGKYLFNLFKSMRLETRIDENGNVIVDMPASIGCENVPRTILQAHMDMVCVANKDIKYNPLTDSIKLIRTEQYLQADGTSLGADDGMGISEIIYILKNIKAPHGPIRAIFTVDEEVGMSGAANLDKKYLEDAKYFINCDSENCNELVIGSAGSVHIDFVKSIRYIKPTMNRAFKLIVSGLHGGHSGEEINTGRANAIKILGYLLNSIDKVEIANIDGGKATNAIPDHAEAIIVTNSGIDVNPFNEKFKNIYGNIESNANIICESMPMPDSVIEDSDKIIDLILMLHSGVYEMSPIISNLVETSANLGIIRTDNDKLTLKFFPRSSVYERLNEFVATARIIAKITKCDVEIGEPSPVWTENKNSQLAKIVNDIFNNQNGKPMNIKTIHAGLECSYFFNKNPNLDIVSVGTTNEHIHSPRERLLLSTIEIQVKLILATLNKIAAEN